MRRPKSKSAVPRTPRRYRRWRAQKLAAAPLCVHCAAEGRTVAATELDHVVPLAHGGELMDEANVQALCEAHHLMKTARDFGCEPLPERDAWTERLEGLR